MAVAPPSVIVAAAACAACVIRSPAAVIVGGLSQASGLARSPHPSVCSTGHPSPHQRLQSPNQRPGGISGSRPVSQPSSAPEDPKTRRLPLRFPPLWTYGYFGWSLRFFIGFFGQIRCFFRLSSPRLRLCAAIGATAVRRRVRGVVARPLNQLPLREQDRRAWSVLAHRRSVRCLRSRCARRCLHLRVHRVRLRREGPCITGQCAQTTGLRGAGILIGCVYR